MESAADNVEPKALGRVLADERERQGLSRAEVAQRLHMSAYQVEAIENGDYARLPQGTFLRGFVRNYAKILGLDANALLEHLAEAAPRAPKPGIVVPSQNIRFDPLGERLANPYVKATVLALVAVAMTLAGMYWWLFIRPAPTAGMAKRPSHATPASESRPGPPQQIASAPQPVSPTNAPGEPVSSGARKSDPRAEQSKADAAAKKAQPPAQKAARVERSGASAAILKFRFRGEAWVEVRDAQGKIILSRLNSKGSEAEVAASPPLSVVVGNAPLVEVLYNDREFPLEPHTRVAVARFTVE